MGGVAGGSSFVVSVHHQRFPVSSDPIAIAAQHVRKVPQDTQIRYAYTRLDIHDGFGACLDSLKPIFFVPGDYHLKSQGGRYRLEGGSGIYDSLLQYDAYNFTF